MGVVRVKELAIGLVDLKQARAKWRMLRDRTESTIRRPVPFQSRPGYPSVRSTNIRIQRHRFASALVAKGERVPRKSKSVEKIDGQHGGHRSFRHGGLTISCEQINVAPHRFRRLKRLVKQNWILSASRFAQKVRNGLQTSVCGPLRRSASLR